MSAMRRVQRSQAAPVVRERAQVPRRWAGCPAVVERHGAGRWILPSSSAILLPFVFSRRAASLTRRSFRSRTW